MDQAVCPGSGGCGRLDAYAAAVKAMAKQCPRAGNPDEIWFQEAQEVIADFSEELA